MAENATLLVIKVTMGIVTTLINVAMGIVTTALRQFFFFLEVRNDGRIAVR